MPSPDWSRVPPPDAGAMVNVLEACADALLTACAVAAGADMGSPSDIEGCRGLAVAALDVVITRTKREGPRPT